MKRVDRLHALRVDAQLHALASEPGTEARRIRDARSRRITAAYWVEVERVDAARQRRVAAYLKRSGRAA